MRKSETVVLKIQIHCDECVRKVKRALAEMDGVESIVFDLKLQKVTVSGDIDAKQVLKKVKKTGKHVELMPSSKDLKDFKGFDAKDFNKIIGGLDIRKGEAEKKRADSDKKRSDHESEIHFKTTSDSRQSLGSGKQKGEIERRFTEPNLIKHQLDLGNPIDHISAPTKVKNSDTISYDNSYSYSFRPEPKPNPSYSYAHNDTTFMFSEDNPQSCSIM